MKLTNGQKNALHEFNSGKNILLLGDPGTGKSTLISAIVENAVATGKKVVRTASTGIAAQLIGGRTIHSLLKAFPGMSTNNIDYDSKAKNLVGIDVLIIDEISMLGKTFIDYLYQCLLHTDHHIQLVLVGDFFQLPPVNDGYAFTSICWRLLHLVPCMLTEVVRQNETDFILNINLLKYGDRRCLDYLIIPGLRPTPAAVQRSLTALQPI